MPIHRETPFSCETTCLTGLLPLMAIALFVSGGCREAQVPEARETGALPSATAAPAPDAATQDAPADDFLRASDAPTGTAPVRPNVATPGDAQTVQQHLQIRHQLDQDLWAAEVEAQRHEQPFIDLWDTLRSLENEFDTLSEIAFRELRYHSPRLAAELSLQIKEFAFDQTWTTIGRAQWLELLDDWERRGYRLVQSEWHHSRFQPATESAPAESVVSFVLDIKRDEPVELMTLRGNLRVIWARPIDGSTVPQVDSLELLDATALVRNAPATFRQVLSAGTTATSPRILPLLLYDLDGNGASEIILGGLNRIYWNDGQGRFTPEPLTSPGVELFDAAVLGDFTGDSHVDLLYVGNQRLPFLLEGDATGRFLEPPRPCADYLFELPKSFTAGDIDGDGDLDVWIGQYKFPYIDGSMPTPFYDSNDGYPAVLLQNDGRGNFQDVTEESGLSVQRNRRTYSSSMVDLDGDGDLDLMTVNDFCGVDVYENDGQGRFTDVSAKWLSDRHLFGMGHTLADYNRDGQLDMYVIGMSSTTARRLDRLNLGRADHPDVNAKRQVMGYGNRMLLAAPPDSEGPRFQQAPWNDHIARTGWSWGTTSFDIDNNSFVDIYVANGHNSGQSARDYCTRYWCHDVYTGTSQNDPELLKLFGLSLQELHQGKISWNGFEHNVLWLNQANERFVNAAFLLGAGFEFDGRAVASDDLDNDGRRDLLVVRFSSKRVDRAEYELIVVRNELATDNHWIGLRLSDSVTGRCPIGAHVRVTLANGEQLVQQIVTGDSFSTQHAPTVHFGLGQETHVSSLDVRWHDGTQWSLASPAIDQYHAPPRQLPDSANRDAGVLNSTTVARLAESGTAAILDQLHRLQRAPKTRP